jgi:hypothetical protein
MPKPFSGTILAVCGSLILSACGNSSTGPHAPSPAQIARHIDSLMIATRNGSRFELLFVALDGPAEGVAPITVSVTTASGTQQWQGYILKYAGSVASADSNFDLIAYSDYALTNVLWVEKRYFSAQNVTTAANLLTDSTTLISQGSGTMTAMTVSIGGSCQLASGLDDPSVLPPGTCNLATFTGSLSWSFPVTGEFQTISIASQTFSGLTDTTTP